MTCFFPTFDKGRDTPLPSLDIGSSPMRDSSDASSKRDRQASDELSDNASRQRRTQHDVLRRRNRSYLRQSDPARCPHTKPLSMVRRRSTVRFRNGAPGCANYSYFCSRSSATKVTISCHLTLGRYFLTWSFRARVSVAERIGLVPWPCRQSAHEVSRLTVVKEAPAARFQAKTAERLARTDSQLSGAGSERRAVWSQ